MPQHNSKRRQTPLAPTLEDSASSRGGEFEAGVPGGSSLWGHVWACVWIVLLTATVRVPLLNVPLERDEGEYAYIAWRLEYNELPYRDWVDQKPPAIFWVYRAALSLPCEPVCAVHFVGLLFAAASSVALYFLLSRFVSRFWATIAACLFVVLSADPLIDGTAANTELFMLLPLILSQQVFLSATTEVRRRIVYMMLAGALTGLVVALKQVAAVNWLLQIAVFPLLIARDKKLKNTLSFAIFSTAGAACVWGVILIYFALRQGLGDLIYNVFTHNLEYVSAVAWSTRLELCRDTLATLSRTEAIAWILSAIGLIALWLRGRRKSFAFAAGWMITSLAGVSASGYYFPHYFQQLLPVLCLTAAVGAETLCGSRLWRRIPAWTPRAALCLILAIPPMIVMYPFL